MKSILLIMLFNIIFPDCTGQVTFTVSKPRLTFSNDSLIIKYNISGVSPNDKFNVWLEITDSSGAKINAGTLKGDIGDSIKAGVNNQIVWNLSSDNIFINNTINIEIIAEKITIPETVLKEKDLSDIPPDLSKKGDMADKKASHNVIKEPEPTLTRVKAGKHLLQSAIFPGWGLTSLTNGKPYWLMGVAGVGCIASSVYFNQKAQSSYNDYLESSDDDIIGYFDDAVTQGNISKAFAWSAAAIWIADLGIVSIKAANMKKSNRKSKLNALSIGSCIDSYTYTPMLSLYYNF